MAVQGFSEEMLKAALEALREIAESAAKETMESRGQGPEGYQIIPKNVAPVGEDEIVGEFSGPVWAVELGGEVERGERLLYLVPQTGSLEQEEAAREMLLELLKANARHFLDGLSPGAGGQLTTPKAEIWESVEPDRLPSGPLLRIDYVASKGEAEQSLTLVLPAGKVNQLLQAGTAVQESQETQPDSEREAMNEERATDKVEVTPPEFQEFSEQANGRTPRNLEMLYDLTLTVSVELGRTEMTIGQVLELGKGSIVELDKLAGDPVDLYINGRKFAEGDVVVVEDRFGVRVTSLVGRAERIKSLGGGG